MWQPLTGGELTGCGYFYLFDTASLTLCFPPMFLGSVIRALFW